jgi:hypothetical protein
MSKAQQSINIVDGPVFTAALLITSDGQQLLFVVAHHLVIDMVSWRIVVHDLDEFIQRNQTLSQRALSFQNWNEMQKNAAEAGMLALDASLPFEVPVGDFAYWGMESRQNTYGDAVVAGFTLSQELTLTLQTTCNKVFRTEAVDIYLSALLLSFAQTFLDRPAPIIWNQEHGRESSSYNGEPDIADTVGWFASLCPMRVDVAAGDDPVQALRLVKDVRRSIPRRGIPYFASQFFCAHGKDPPATTATDWPLEVMFSYAGSLQQIERDNGVLEQLAPGQPLGSQASDIGSAVGRIALFEVAIVVDQGAATIKFIYSSVSRHQQHISQWVRSYEHLLLETIGRLRCHHQELTLSDVPLLNTTYQGLARLNRDRLLTLGLKSIKEIETVLPATALQQEALISQIQTPDACHNHFTYELTLGLEGDVPDGAMICNAWEQVVAACPALRTVFIDSVSVDGLFDQVVLRKCSPRMLFIEAGRNGDPVTALNALPSLLCKASEPNHRLTVCKARRSTYLKLEISQTLCDVGFLIFVFNCSKMDS